MPLHHTTDPAERAADIAEMEANRAYYDSGGERCYFKEWLETYREVMFEMFCGLPEGANLIGRGEITSKPMR